MIKTVFADATVIIIAHRLDNVRNMDRIMHLKNGKLINFTTPQEMFKDDWSVYKLEDKGENRYFKIDCKMRCGVFSYHLFTLDQGLGLPRGRYSYS